MTIRSRKRRAISDIWDYKGTEGNSIRLGAFIFSVGVHTGVPYIHITNVCMLNQDVTRLLERDLNKLKEELTLYKNESTIWQLKPGIANTAGNLTLHLMGNLNHFIGALLGNTGYVRQRDLEFSNKNVSRGQMLGDIDKTLEVVRVSLNKLSDADLQKEFPVEMLGTKNTAAFTLLIIITHFNYHLGQINYHRRLLED